MKLEARIEFFSINSRTEAEEYRTSRERGLRGCGKTNCHDRFYITHLKVKATWKYLVRDGLMMETGTGDVSPNPWRREKEGGFLRRIRRF